MLYNAWHLQMLILLSLVNFQKEEVSSRREASRPRESKFRLFDIFMVDSMKMYKDTELLFPTWYTTSLFLFHGNASIHPAVP